LNPPTSSGELDNESGSGGQELSSRSSGELGSGSSGESGSRSSEVVLQDAPMGDPIILNQQVSASLAVPAPLIVCY
jgi:hypothetical protein